MGGTHDGGIKTSKTNKAKYGENYYKEMGRKGGAAGKGHKFAHGKADPAIAGMIGGKKSKRGPGKHVLDEIYQEDIHGSLPEPDDKHPKWYNWRNKI